MSKKIIRITKEGVRESISGNYQGSPPSVEVQFGNATLQLGEATLVQGFQYVNNATTGSAEKPIIFAYPGSLVILPPSPVVAQKFEIYNPTNSASAITVEASQEIFGGSKEINLSGAEGKAEFIYSGTKWIMSIVYNFMPSIPGAGPGIPGPI